MGASGVGIEAISGGLIPIPHLLPRFRRSRVCGGFVFRSGFVCAVVSRRHFSVASGGGSFVRRFRFALGYLCVSYSDRAPRLTIFLEIFGNIANLAPPVCRVRKAFRVY